MRPYSVSLLVLSSIAIASCDRPASKAAITAPATAPLFSRDAGRPASLPEWRDQPSFASPALAAPAHGSPGVDPTLGEAWGSVDLAGTSVGTESYRFAAANVATVANGTTDVSAVGHIEFRAQLGLVGEGDVDCLTVVGNTARLTARWTRATFQGEPSPIPEGQHLIWVVQDVTGRGRDSQPRDMASEVYQTTAAHAAALCTAVVLPMQPIDRGRVHVRPRERADGAPGADGP